MDLDDDLEKVNCGKQETTLFDENFEAGVPEMARRITAPAPRKKISSNDLLGQRGISLIRTIMGEIGFVWYETGAPEAGIDGYIEIRDRQTGEVTNNILQVQSKATDQSFEKETADGFEFLCDQRDLEYWLGGNAPVILVRSRPRTNEAYWVSIKDYFSDPQKRASRKIVFDKQANRLSNEANCIQSLTNIAVPKETGLYLSAMPKREKVYLNLLPIIRFPERIAVARTKYRTRLEVERELRKSSEEKLSFFVLHGGNIYALYDLTKPPWNRLCDRDTAERYDAKYWALDDTKAARDNLVQLLDIVLRGGLAKHGVDFHEGREYYYFRDTDDLSEKKIDYKSIQKKTDRSVFEAYAPKDSVGPAHYRHSGFYAKFVRYEDTWYLEINPTYHFTADGRQPYRFAHNSLSGLKRLEKNGAVMGQVVMWAEFIRGIFPPTNLTNVDEPNRFEFAPLPALEMDRGIPDKAWLKSEEGDDTQIIEADIESMGLFGL